MYSMLKIIDTPYINDNIFYFINKDQQGPTETGFFLISLQAQKNVVYDNWKQIKKNKKIRIIGKKIINQIMNY